jgi:hypothetical protein
MTLEFEGDPKLILGPSGSRFEYKSGQPVMDRGVENSMLIDLFTKSKGLNSHQNGWIGNYLISDQDQKIGSDYQDKTENVPITLAGLATIEQEAKKALKGKVYGDVESSATNPTSDKRVNTILVHPPAGAFEFRTETFSQLWQAQAVDPANERI